MRLVPITRRVGPPERHHVKYRFPHRQRFLPRGADRISPHTPCLRRLGAIALIALVLLVGCSGGTANEAERAQRRAASEPAVLADRQATANAAQIAVATPSAEPTATPAITVFGLGLAQQLGPNHEPSQLIATVPSDVGTVYVVIELNGLPRGTAVSATWLVNASRPEDRAVIATVEQTLENDGRQWIAFPFTLDGTLPPGMYAVVVEYGADALGTLSIEVTNPGTPPRRV